MRRIIDDQIKYRIERVPGVASMDVWGGLQREVHVNLDADKVKALDLPLDLIVARGKSGQHQRAGTERSSVATTTS